MPAKGRSCFAVWLAVVAAVSGVGESASAQTLSGLLLEDVTDAPVDLGDLVLLTLDGDSVDHALSNEDGYFVLRAPESGRYFVAATALGYQPARSERIDLADGELRVIQLSLTPRPIPVEGVLVDGESPGEILIPELIANGFYDRLRKGQGEFLTPAQIEAHAAVYTPQLFRELQFVDVVPGRDRGTGPWNDRLMIVRNTGATLDSRRCEPYIWIDDVLVELLPGESLEDAAPRGTVEAIEVHRAPFGAPLRYLRDFDPGRQCGAILIWTNRR